MRGELSQSADTAIATVPALGEWIGILAGSHFAHDKHYNKVLQCAPTVCMLGICMYKLGF